MNNKSINSSLSSPHLICDHLSFALNSSSPLSTVFKTIPESDFPAVLIRFFNLMHLGAAPTRAYNLSSNRQIKLFSQFIKFATPKNFKQINNILISSMLIEIICIKNKEQQQKLDKISLHDNSSYFDFLDTGLPAVEWEKMITAIHNLQNKTVGSSRSSKFNINTIVNEWNACYPNISEEYTENNPINIKQKIAVWEAFAIKSKINKIKPGSIPTPLKI